jgi:ankyrin repeat protein
VTGDSRGRGGEALYHACEFPDPTCAELLIDAGTDPDVVDYCLGRALNFPDPTMAEMFCAHGARPWPAHLHQAVWRRRPERTVRALLDAGAAIDAPDEHGLTALRIATRWGHAPVAALLRDRGADPTGVTDEDRALGAFLSGASSLASGARGLDEMLNLAVQAGDLEAVRRLLDAGARIDGALDSEDHPLGQAAWRGYPHIVRELVARGAELTFPDGGSAIGAALHGSRHCHDPEGGPTMRTIDDVPQPRYAEVVRILIAAGARIPAKLWDGAPAPATFIAELGLELPG